MSDIVLLGRKMQAFGWAYYVPVLGSQDKWEWATYWTCGDSSNQGARDAIDRFAQFAEVGHICAIVYDHDSLTLGNKLGRLINDAEVDYVCQASDGTHTWYEVWFDHFILSINEADAILRKY